MNEFEKSQKSLVIMDDAPDKCDVEVPQNIEIMTGEMIIYELKEEDDVGSKYIDEQQEHSQVHILHEEKDLVQPD